MSRGPKGEKRPRPFWVKKRTWLKGYRALRDLRLLKRSQELHFGPAN
jgi:hypothetical protein